MNFWADAMSFASLLVDRSPRGAPNCKVTEQSWTVSVIDCFGYRVFGCPASMHVFSQDNSKLNVKFGQYIFLVIRKSEIF